MATPQDSASIAPKTSTLAEDVDKELTCAICLSRYETPKVLPCLHTYCKGCLGDLLAKSREPDRVTCPQCKEEHKLPEDGVDGFKTYFTINNLLELLQVHEIGDKGETSTQVIRCGSGLDENRAVAHCSNCCYYLCETCLNNHRVFTRGHNTVLLEKVKQSDKPTGAKSLQKVQYCKDHEDEVLKLFCKTCKKVICRDCALVKHRDHDYTFIREIRPEVQQQLEALTREVQAKEVEYKSHIDYLENVRGIGTDTLASCEREVNETFHRVQEAIESRRAALIAQLYDIHDSEKKQVDHEAEGLQFTLSKLSNSIGFTKQLLANGSDVEVVSMSVQAVQTLENLKTVNWDKNSIKPTLMRVKFDPEFEKHVKKFGVTSHGIQPEDILVKLPKETAYVGKEVKFEVYLSKEISERGYDATSELAVQLVHTTDNAKTVCNLCKTNPNTWEASCIPDAEGKYEVSAVLGNVKAGSSIIKVACFHSQEHEDLTSIKTGATSAYEVSEPLLELYLPIPELEDQSISPSAELPKVSQLPKHSEPPTAEILELPTTGLRYGPLSKGKHELTEAASHYEPGSMEVPIPELEDQLISLSAELPKVSQLPKHSEPPTVEILELLTTGLRYGPLSKGKHELTEAASHFEPGSMEVPFPELEDQSISPSAELPKVSELPKHSEPPTVEIFELPTTGLCYGLLSKGKHELTEAASHYEPGSMEVPQTVPRYKPRNMGMLNTVSHSRRPIDALDEPSESQTCSGPLSRQISTQLLEKTSKSKRTERSQKSTQKYKKGKPPPEWSKWVSYN